MNVRAPSTRVHATNSHKPDGADGPSVRGVLSVRLKSTCANASETRSLPFYIRKMRTCVAPEYGTRTVPVACAGTAEAARGACKMTPSRVRGTS